MARCWLYVENLNGLILGLHTGSGATTAVAERSHVALYSDSSRYH